MPLSKSNFYERNYLNVLQIVAINILATIGLLVCALALGVPLIGAIVSAWIMGAMATIGVAAVIFLRQERRVAKAEAAMGGLPLVPANIRDPLQLWEADRLMEVDYARAATGLDSRRNVLPEVAAGDEPAERELRKEQSNPSIKRRAG